MITKYVIKIMVKSFRDILALVAVVITIMGAVGGYSLGSRYFLMGWLGLLVGLVTGFMMAAWVTGYFLTAADNRDVNKRNQELLEQILEAVKQ
jgi:hypothetical protein